MREDPVQWPIIQRMFELADVGAAGTGEGLSVRKVAKQLTQEGCAFSPDRVRCMLRDPIYATGEYTATVRGHTVAQTPLVLADPVPLDRFLRVQDQLAMRGGKTSLTAVGEFLFNTVDVRHAQCRDATHNDKPVRIRGYVRSDSEQTRIYRHIGACPEGCRDGGRGFGGAFTWDRDLLERAVMTEIRRLASHPELLDALRVATRHQLADTSARMTEAQRTEVRRAIADLEAREQALVPEWLGQPTEQAAAFSDFRTPIAGIDQRITQHTARLEADDRARRADAARAAAPDPYLASFLEIMSLDTPDDPHLRQLRARIFQQIISRLEVDDPGSEDITITIEGCLIPEDAPLAAEDPLGAARELLEYREVEAPGETPRPDRDIAVVEAEVAHHQTDVSLGNRTSVSTPIAALLELPTTDSVRRMRSASMSSNAWRTRGSHCRQHGTPGWRSQITVAVLAPPPTPH